MTNHIVALSINQPWAGLITIGWKDIENRDWSTDYRGPVLIHAGLKVDRTAWEDVERLEHPVTGDDIDQHRDAIMAGREAGAFRTGGVIGEARVVDCVRRSTSPWFTGRYGLVLTDARVTPFRPCKGALGLFLPDFDSRYAPRRVGARVSGGAS